MQPRYYPNIIFKILVVLGISYFTLSSFLFRNTEGFIYVYFLTQLLVIEHCIDHYLFIEVCSKSDYIEKGSEVLFSKIAYIEVGFGVLLSCASYMTSLLGLPLFLIIIFDAWVNSWGYYPFVSPLNNYLFVYPFLFFYDLFFILFFRYWAKNATKIQSADKNKVKGDMK